MPRGVPRGISEFDQDDWDSERITQQVGVRT
jgi:hypothetical protein